MNSQVLRLLDANLNRAREALRVIEDYARFVLDNGAMSAELKQLRHDLSQGTEEIVGVAILHRDTPGDVGTANKTASELARQDLSHVVIASGKRLGEALRAIEEFLKTIDPAAASKVETIRYHFYDLEARIALTLRPAACGLADVRLYVLITESICKRPWLEATEQAIRGGADCVQLREKNLEGAEFLSRARQFVDLCRQHNVISIINDRADIALLSNADGVHVGQDDLPAREVRKFIGTNKIVGVSTHRIEQARQAVLDGADYIGIGPVFPSQTKPRDFLPGLEYARQVAAEIKIPAIAIAGITVENVNEVLATGIGAVAVTNAVLCSPDVIDAARQLKQKLVASQTGGAGIPACLGSMYSSSQSSDVGVPTSEADKNYCPTDSSGQRITRKRRRLPHWTMPGATYFLTFRVAKGEFTIPERMTILEHLKSGDGRYYNLFAAVVMPDHAHVLIEPVNGFDLSRIMNGTKGVTARLVNEARGTRGSIWQDESFDRIMRDQAELEEKTMYIVDNPVKRELVADPWEYPALYVKFE